MLLNQRLQVLGRRVVQVSVGVGPTLELGVLFFQHVMLLKEPRRDVVERYSGSALQLLYVLVHLHTNPI